MSGDIAIGIATGYGLDDRGVGVRVPARSISYEAPHYAVFYNLLSLHLFSVQIFSSAPCSQTPSGNLVNITYVSFRFHKCVT
jgi:hypothetical protein